ncbi:hypothetical protein AQJ11_39150 [Streptomyces corchorusii]|uniref:Uncharacterized protein n=1 Tax=Streptomyces corchorusii TaxID=1903 RepID=A0A101PS31_STRCK|nr:hypothetical protein AQJ11_39150 [Streptomyces corchorusii]
MRWTSLSASSSVANSRFADVGVAVCGTPQPGRRERVHAVRLDFQEPVEQGCGGETTPADDEFALSGELGEVLLHEGQAA